MEEKLSRKEAKARGLKCYHGKVCEKHPELDGERQIWKANCVGCQRERQRERMRVENMTPEQAERQRARYRSRQQTPKGRALRQTYKSKRRALKRNAEVNLTAAEHHTIAAMYAEAARLTQDTGYAWHVHHVRALSRGGLHHPSNLEVIPAEINLRIGDKELTFTEYVGIEL